MAPLTAPLSTTESKTDQLAYEPGDADKFSHYAPKHLIADAMVFGTPIRAICGKTWVPTRDGEKFPVCPDCKSIYAGLPANHEGE